MPIFRKMAAMSTLPSTQFACALLMLSSMKRTLWQTL